MVHYKYGTMLEFTDFVSIPMAYCAWLHNLAEKAGWALLIPYMSCPH